MFKFAEWYKTMSEKEKMLVTSPFSFSHNVFQRDPNSCPGSIPGSANIFFQELMIVIATGFIPLSQLSIVLTMVTCWIAASDLERILCGVLVKGTSEKHG